MTELHGSAERWTRKTLRNYSGENDMKNFYEFAIEAPGVVIFIFLITAVCTVECVKLIVGG